ncbi:MAG: glutaredoxin family protein [Solirubrobacteraceae bacterium]
MTPSSLELWQTEWCPASHRVRQRLTELGISYTIHQVPVRCEARAQLQTATGHTTIPVLLAGGEVIAGEAAILTYLNERFTEPADAEQQRAKAAIAKRKELEQACPQLAATA